MKLGTPPASRRWAKSVRDDSPSTQRGLNGQHHLPLKTTRRHLNRVRFLPTVLGQERRAYRRVPSTANEGRAMSTSASLDSSSVQLQAGEQVVIPLQIRNNGEIVEGYRLEVVGPPAAWSTVEP